MTQGHRQGKSWWTAYNSTGHLEAAADALQSLHCCCSHTQPAQQPATAVRQHIEHAQHRDLLQVWLVLTA